MSWNQFISFLYIVIQFTPAYKHTKEKEKSVW